MILDYTKANTQFLAYLIYYRLIIYILLIVFNLDTKNVKYFNLKNWFQIINELNTSSKLYVLHINNCCE